MEREKIKIEEFLDRIYNEDILQLIRRLPDNSIDCIYADPDYNVGVKYNNKLYTKKFNEYLVWLMDLSSESYRVLKNTGNMFMINYPKNNAYLRVRYLDEHFYDVNEYVWIYNTNIGQSPKRFTTAHRSILHCTKTKNNKFYKDNVVQPYKNPTDKRILENIKRGSKGRMPYSWFYFDLVKNVSQEKTFHACQIPQKLSEMLINSCTMPGGIVLILFGGSGSEISVCIQNHRRFISAEIDPNYYKMIIDRINKEGEIDNRFRLILKGRNQYKDLQKQGQLNFVLERKENYVTGSASK